MLKSFLFALVWLSPFAQAQLLMNTECGLKCVVCLKDLNLKKRHCSMEFKDGSPAHEDARKLTYLFNGGHLKIDNLDALKEEFNPSQVLNQWSGSGCESVKTRIESLKKEIEIQSHTFSFCARPPSPKPFRESGNAQR